MCPALHAALQQVLSGEGMVAVRCNALAICRLYASARTRRCVVALKRASVRVLCRALLHGIRALSSVLRAGVCGLIRRTAGRYSRRSCSSLDRRAGEPRAYQGLQQSKAKLYNADWTAAHGLAVWCSTLH